jgi:hypothetical protein
MPESRKIQVQTYAGYRAGEIPRKVILSGKDYPVMKVLGSGRVRRSDGQGDEEHFKVSLRDYGEANIVYHHSWDGWTLEEKSGGKPLSEMFLEIQEKRKGQGSGAGLRLDGSKPARK